jgi:ABC-type multidrug transport system fused ATPase/permease subunit
MMSGSGFIIMMYCLAFMFNNRESAARQAFMVMVIIILIPVIVWIIIDYPPSWVEWLFSLIPILHVQRLLTHVLINIGIWSHDLGYYWRYDNSQPFLVFHWASIPLYGGILMLIEIIRVHLQKSNARRTFGDYGEFFETQKAKHPMTDEARAMEEEVLDHHNNYAVRIMNCSQLFFNTAGDPIPAVNGVSLGIKEGSLFGFLVANGAGKTTLMKMITSMLPPSDGRIEILGRDIPEYSDRTLLSICPHFNTHMCQELTPYEHFVIYA